MAGETYIEVPLEAFDAARLALEQPDKFEVALRVMEQAMTPLRPGYLTKVQAADYAQVSVRTLSRAIHDQELRSAGTRGLVRIKPEWIDAWLAQRDGGDHRDGDTA